MEKEREMISYSHNKFLNVFIVDLSYCAPQLHSDFEIDLILNGQVTVRTPDGADVLNPGDAAVFSPERLHEIISFSGNSRILCIQFPSAPNDEAYVSLFRGLYFKTVPVRGHFSRAPEKYELFFTLCLKLACLYFRQGENSEYVCSSILGLIAYYLKTFLPTGRLSSDDAFESEPRSDRITRILSKIENNFSSKLLLSDIAEEEELSLSYLSHFFKSYMHMTFQEYLNKQRFEHACTMLLSTNKTILEISELCGFSDMRYLTEMCRKTYGCTPQKYREANKPPRHLSRNAAQYYLTAEESLNVLNPLLAEKAGRFKNGSFLDIFE
ncbi:MAG: helix-turn-helix transcriptional regulator [Clostridia bacterium]|nr:helix-turn-helix transcriptional regulator [Clostridia bacterium]